MFKKRERPSSARQRDEAGDGETGAVPSGVTEKAARVASSAAASGEGGLIGATTRRGDASEAARLEDRAADVALSGFSASDTKQHNTPSENAVRVLETETEVGKDVRSMHERNQDIHKKLKAGELESGVYRGLKGYKQYAERSDGAISASKYSGLLGPTRGSSNVRMTMRVEYWASSSGTDGGICKDYKETGYCGFGDSCKFLHDRSDYKSGHLIEKEWEDKQKAIQAKKRERWEKKALRSAADGGDAGDASSAGSDASDSDGDVPTSCPACNSKWEECKSIPVQTQCGHYFCEDCAMENFARTPKCMSCELPTNGIFNSCEQLEEKIRQKKAQKAATKKKTAQRNSSGNPYGISLEDS